MICLSLRHLLDLEVGVHVTTVDVAHGVRLHQDVIKTSVEDGLLFIGSLDVDAVEFSLPYIVSVLNICIKIPTFSLGEHVFACAVIINRGDGDFHDKLLIVVIIKA